MKTSNDKKAYAFKGAAALITAALLAVSLLFTACPNSVGGGSGGNSAGSTSGPGGGGTGRPVKIKFDESSITVYKQGSGRIHTEDTVYEGTRLSFNAKNLPAGQQVDKWKVNTKVLDYSGYTVNAADAVPEDSDKVIEVTYTTKTAQAVKIRFDESTITVRKDGSDEIHTEDTVYEGTWLSFDAKNLPAGQLVDKWKVNTEVLNYSIYKVDAADAVEEGGVKVITVTYTTKAAQGVVIKFNPSTVEVYNSNTHTPIAANTSVYEGTELRFEPKGIPAQAVDKWKVNAKKLEYYWYTVDAADAIDEGGQKVIEVTYTTKSDKAVVIKFNPSTVEVYNSNTHTPIAANTTVYEGTALTFEPKGIPVGQRLDKWKVNAKELEDSWYRVNAADAVLNGSDKVIEITYTTKPTQGPFIVKFDQRFVTVYDREKGVPIPFGQQVYEGTVLSFTHPLANKWFVNAKELRPHDAYIVDPADAIYENGVKVLRVRFSVHSAVMLTVQFNPAHIECKTFDGTAINPGDSKPAYTYVILKAKVPSGKSVKHWEIQGIRLHNTEGVTELESQADPGFAGAGGIINVGVVFE